jgi:hypothetical protein
MGWADHGQETKGPIGGGRWRGWCRSGGPAVRTTSFSDVTPAELTAIRTRLGMSPEGLAAELDLTPGVVRAWEGGRIAPSRRAERWLIWRGAMLDRDEALAGSGLGECAILRGIVADRTSGAGSRSDAVLAHMTSCPTCLARKQFLDERFPPMPAPPLPAALLILVWAHDVVARGRQWWRGRFPGRGASKRSGEK